MDEQTLVALARYLPGLYRLKDQDGSYTTVQLSLLQAQLIHLNWEPKEVR